MFLKSLGYLLSIASVILLGIVSFQATRTNPELFWPLALGMGTSIIGIGLRWLANARDARRKAR